MSIRRDAVQELRDELIRYGEWPSSRSAGDYDGLTLSQRLRRYKDLARFARRNLSFRMPEELFGDWWAVGAYEIQDGRSGHEAGRIATMRIMSNSDHEDYSAPPSSDRAACGNAVPVRCAE